MIGESTKTKRDQREQIVRSKRGIMPDTFGILELRSVVMLIPHHHGLGNVGDRPWPFGYGRRLMANRPFIEERERCGVWSHEHLSVFTAKPKLRIYRSTCMVYADPDAKFAI